MSISSSFVRHFRKRKRVRSLKSMSHNERVAHFINLGLDKWRAEQIAREYQ